MKRKQQRSRYRDILHNNSPIFHCRIQPYVVDYCAMDILCYNHFAKSTVCRVFSVCFDFFLLSQRKRINSLYVFGDRSLDICFRQFYFSCAWRDSNREISKFRKVIQKLLCVVFRFVSRTLTIKLTTTEKRTWNAPIFLFPFLLIF